MRAFILVIALAGCHAIPAGETCEPRGVITDCADLSVQNRPTYVSQDPPPPHSPAEPPALREGCNGNGCAPGTGRGRSEQHERSAQDGD